MTVEEMLPLLTCNNLHYVIFEKTQRIPKIKVQLIEVMKNKWQSNAY